MRRSPATVTVFRHWGRPVSPVQASNRTGHTRVPTTLSEPGQGSQKSTIGPISDVREKPRKSKIATGSIPWRGPLTGLDGVSEDSRQHAFVSDPLDSTVRIFVSDPLPLVYKREGGTPMQGIRSNPFTHTHTHRGLEGSLPLSLICNPYYEHSITRTRPPVRHWT